MDVSGASCPGGKRILAVASGGGHWVQLLRLRPAFEGCDVTFATVQAGYQTEVKGFPFRIIPDAHRWDKLSALRCAIHIFFLLLRLRPDVVITTGAAPGYFAVRFGRIFGARTIWVDSIANAEELSLSGQLIESKADLWLTQWPHLAKENGPVFRGNVL